jgi:fermentation-respiration switch protein FrsA (DUF1100 family)
VLTWCENRLVYRAKKARREWVEPPSPEIEDVYLFSADGSRIHAWWLPCPGSGEALLYLHGNAGNLSQRGGSMLKLRHLLGTAVLIPDYPGYGKSAGRPTETGCYQAADAAYDWLTQEHKVDPQNILLYGASLGGGVAVELGSRREHRALVLVKTFTSLPDAAKALHPWLPVHWLMRNRFDNLARIRSCQRPVFIGHGDADRYVPYVLGQRLYEAANEPKHFFTMRGDGHNDRMPEDFFKSLRSFLREVTALR